MTTNTTIDKSNMSDRERLEYSTGWIHGYWEGVLDVRDGRDFYVRPVTRTTNTLYHAGLCAGYVKGQERAEAEPNVMIP